MLQSLLYFENHLSLLKANMRWNHSYLCSMSEPISLSAKCNDIDLAPSLSLSESSGTKFGCSFTKCSYSLHLKHLILSLFILVLDPNLELDSDLTLLSLSLDLDCLHVLLFSQVLPVLLLNLPRKLPL